MQHKHTASGDSIAHLAAKVRRAFTNHLNRSFKQAGFNVTVEQFVVLMILRQAGELSQQEIATLSSKNKTSITRLLDNLEKKCLIVRNPGKNDGRQKMISLSARGKSLIDAIIIHTEIDDEIAEKGIAPEELKICKSVLNKIYQNLAGVKDD